MPAFRFPVRQAIAMAVTPSNTVDGPFPNADTPFGYFQALRVQTAVPGDVVVVTPSGIAVTFVGCPNGTILPVTGRRVNATGTTVDSVVAFRRM